MLSTYQAPGVYVEWLDHSAQQLVVGRTDVAGFVGLAPRGPVQAPTKIESVQQFFSTFGDVTRDAYLAYAVIGFFENGGRTCWVVRATDPKGAQTARVRLAIAGRAAVELEATSPGEWGNAVTIEPRLEGERVTGLTARAPERPPQDIDLDPPTESANRPRTNLLGVQDSALPEVRAGLLVRFPEDPDPTQPAVDLVAAGQVPLKGGTDGKGDPQILHLTGDDTHEWGVTALGRIDGISFVAVPDLMAPNSDDTRITDTRITTPRFDEGKIADAQLAIINHCLQSGDRMAILDVPPVQANRALVHRSHFPRLAAAAAAALYHPWVAVVDPQRFGGPVRFIPPSGHVAGMFARTDRLRGVHKPPANEILEGVYDVAESIDEVTHGRLNQEGVNAIRIVPGRGTLVLGARTLSEDVRWRYINIRRLFSLVTESLDEQMQWAVFEPNNPQLWRHIERAVEGFLERLYRAGMLDGETSEQAYSVRCDADTNKPEDTDLGRVFCIVGVQPPYPAEFVVVRIGVTRSGIEIDERGAQDV